MKLLAVTFLLLSISSNAQEERVSEVTAPTPTRHSHTPQLFRVEGLFSSFRNQSFRTAGITYGLEVGYESLSEFFIYVGAPVLYGQVQGKNVHEMGNFYLGGELMTYENSGVQIWTLGENKFSQSNGEIASRHNTLIPGLDIRYDRLKMIGNVGAKYHWRYGEADSKADIKDILSLHFSLGRRIGRRLTLGAEVLWFRAQGVTNESLVIAPPVDWAGAGPVAKIHMGGGVLMKSSLMFPVHNSRGQAETEVAVWDESLPNVSEVTWRTDIGVQF